MFRECKTKELKKDTFEGEFPRIHLGTDWENSIRKDANQLLGDSYWNLTTDRREYCRWKLGEATARFGQVYLKVVIFKYNFRYAIKYLA